MVMYAQETTPKTMILVPFEAMEPLTQARNVIQAPGSPPPADTQTTAL